jgi:hypothetical protein
MSNDIELNVKENPSVSKIFSLQLDESCDVSEHAQLIAYIRYFEGGSLKTNFYFCKNHPGKTTGEEIFRVMDVYIRENNLRWKVCVSICIDGAASMTGKVKGFKAKVREVNPEIKFDHCFLHRKVIVAKMLPVPFQSVLDEVKIVNFVKSRPLNSHLFTALCQEMGSDHIPPLLHTEIRWLSRGKSLSRVFELHDELR